MFLHGISFYIYTYSQISIFSVLQNITNFTIFVLEFKKDGFLLGRMVLECELYKKLNLEGI